MSPTAASNGTSPGITVDTSFDRNLAAPVSHQTGARDSSRATGCLSESSSSCFGQIRPNCLSRRTSYRTYQKAPIPVATPMSPVDGNILPSGRGSECSFEIKSPSQQSVGSSNSASSCCISPLGSGGGLQSHVPKMMMRRYPTLPEDESCSENGSIQEAQLREIQFNNNNHNNRIPPFEHQPMKTYESLKSQISTSSQGSTGSKMTSSSSGSDKSSNCVSSSEIISADGSLSPGENTYQRGYHPPHHHGNKLPTNSTSQSLFIETCESEDTLAEEAMKGLSFVSPKSGVYRPMSDGRKHRQNCTVM